MGSHVDDAIRARIAAAQARRAQQQADRAAFVERRRHGLATRHARKLRHLAARHRAEQQPATTERTADQ
ncbi:hypothetical protein RM572_26950 [Streptomyces sp. DSM 42041]|uniref:Uncharacterized protein n=1 Tax=Streptomyces hazeniae TaxID=3075538 RepID=A0ABU2P1T3_9ACTN|nr:hypothetical protein [Streptomyces sp. DSM 42041]MDT0382403.1 hypothetical protein [Streptomyces sp. DSM 42041]